MKDAARQLLLELAATHGLHPEVEQLLEGRPDPELPELAQLLSATRARSDLTLPQIHDRTGLSRSQLEFFENGKQRHPGMRTIQALAYGYRLPLGHVLCAALQTYCNPPTRDD